MKNLTKLINHHLDRLKQEINAAPSGGGLGSLREFLSNLQGSIQAFVVLLDEIETVDKKESK